MQSENRRSFMKKAGLASAAAAAECINWNPSARGANEKVVLGLIGCRSQGKNVALDAIKDGAVFKTLCDVDDAILAKVGPQIEAAQNRAPGTVKDFRRVLDDKEIDAVVIATPDHWHVIPTILACQAGKDVYVEKPLSHTIHEGQLMRDAARKYNRVVQVGSQGRSSGGVRKAIDLMRNGAIGEVFCARALCFKKRDSIGFKPDKPVPEGMNFDLWLGPAQERPFNENLVHYNWHWFWDFGNGDLGNQGVHQMDIARWGLGKTLPVKISSTGGRYGYKDQGETPNTQTCTFTFEDGKMLVFEVRGRYTNDEAGVKVGNLFYGADGWVAINGTGGPYDLYLGDKEKPEPRQEGPGENHFENFLKAVRSRNYRDLAAEVAEGVYSADLCHLGNIAYRLGRTLTFNPAQQKFVGDEEADRLLTRAYRAPFVVPASV